MARHQLITAQLQTLAARLPADAVCELADGYDETFQAQLRRQPDPDAAATATIDQFGTADTITEAFTRDSPWRRLAIGLLATGPAVGLLWGATLASQHAWTWPIPLPIRILYGVALLTVAKTLLSALRARRTYRRTRITTTGSAIGLLILDTLMLTAIATHGDLHGWVPVLAAAASLTRIIVVARGLPAALTN